MIFDKGRMLCKALEKPSNFDKACAARSGRLHEPEIVEEFGLSDTCGVGRGQVGCSPRSDQQA